MLIASLELHEHLEVCPLFLHDPHKALETEQVSRLRNLPVSLNRAAAFAHSQILQRKQFRSLGSKSEKDYH